MANKKKQESDYSHREANAGGSTVDIWTVKRPGAYTALYVNQDTRALDELFYLNSTTVIEDSPRDTALTRAVELSALGNTHVEFLLKYFVSRAKVYQIFVGLLEDEVTQEIKNNPRLRSDYRLQPSYIDQALLHEDWIEEQGVIKKVRYLKQISVEGKKVLFPANLRNVQIEPKKS